MGVKRVDPADVIRLYRDEGQTLSQIANRYGVTIQAVAWHLKQHDIPSHAHRVNCPTEEVIAAYQSGESLREIARTYGVSITPIKAILKQHGIERRRPGTWGKPRPVLKGPDAHRWNGGRFVGADGYVRVRIHSDRKGMSAYEMEHRLVWEQANGRKLLPHEVVHHINGDHQDNRPENLIALTNSQHTQLHNREDPDRAHHAGRKGAAIRWGHPIPE